MACTNTNTNNKTNINTNINITATYHAFTTYALWCAYSTDTFAYHSGTNMDEGGQQWRVRR